MLFIYTNALFYFILWSKVKNSNFVCIMLTLSERNAPQSQLDQWAEGCRCQCSKLIGVMIRYNYFNSCPRNNVDGSISDIRFVYTHTYTQENCETSRYEIKNLTKIWNCLDLGKIGIGVIAEDESGMWRNTLWFHG